MNGAKKLGTMQEIIDAIQGFGYTATLQEGVGFMTIHKSGKKFNPVLMTEGEKGKEKLVITCQIAKQGDIDEHNLLECMTALLDINTRIHPFAIGLITSADNPELDGKEDESPIVLISSVAVGDLCVDELKVQIEDLRVALTSSLKVLDLFL